jgi:hypothetical protein
VKLIEISDQTLAYNEILDYIEKDNNDIDMILNKFTSLSAKCIPRTT